MATHGVCSKADVQKYLRETTESLGVELHSDAVAAELDRRDPVAHLRSCFNVPRIKQLLGEERSSDVDPASECVYLCGNSLGLQPKTTRHAVVKALDSWAERGVRGHFVGPNEWMPIEDSVIPGFAKLVGAKAIEVTAMNSLTVNLHLGLVPFYKPTAQRYKIIMEENPFPSDLYAVQSQVRWHGYDPETAIIFAEAQKPGGIWRDQDVVNLIDEVGDEVALVLLSGVHYCTGHFFDIMSITEAGHRKGCCVGWDLAHAVGNVELALHEWGVDFACWCTYKYLNAGPGSIAGFFVHEKHAIKPQLTRLLGWWAHERDTRMKMNNELELQAGAKGFQLSNPPVLECCCLQSSLAVFEQTSMKQLVEKSRLLTGYLELLVEEYLTGRNGSDAPVEVVTSSDLARRGNQLSLRFNADLLSKIHDCLSSRGVVVDARGPLMRVAPAPLYNSFNDVLRFYHVLKQALSEVAV